jgi:hypothetical protein
MSKYKRTLEQLREKAVLHWPDELLEKAGEASVLPLLLKTQEVFLAVLKASTASPTAWHNVINSSSLTGTLFLKHLMVLSDVGGESLNKLTPLSTYFPHKTMTFLWDGSEHEYEFRVIGNKTALTNTALRVDAKGLLTPRFLDDKSFDVVMLLLFGSLSVGDSFPAEIKERCVVGSLMPEPLMLDRFVKENYLRVSRQTGGAHANALGQAVQDHVIDRLRDFLPAGWHLERNGSLVGVTRTSGGEATTFDVVARSPNGVCFGVEVSFQVTTNSTIERKARESHSLKQAVNGSGHIICYVIDGAGNINVRTAATTTLCANSDCTVAMSDEEIRHLADFFTNEASKRT